MILPICGVLPLIVSARSPIPDLLLWTELNNVFACARLWRGKRILSRLHVLTSILLLLGVVSLVAFLLQNNLQKICKKNDFLLKNTGNRKMLSRTTKYLDFKCQLLFFPKLRWILNLVHLSPRCWPHKCDVIFLFSSALPMSLPASRNFFWDHFLKELRHQAQLGNQAFWWFVNNSILISPDWLKCDWMGTGKGTFLLLAREKTNGKLSVNPIFFVIFAWKNITLSGCTPFKYESSAFG